MAATIQSLRNGITPVVGASRDDYVLGDTVLLTCTDPHTTYSWVIAFAPDGSAASLASPTLQTPGSFTVDVEGPYLIQLTVDAGLPTEDRQEVRLRALTDFGQLNLVAAGERRDDGGIVPVDIDVEGWANEQNYNLVTLKDFLKPIVQSGQVLHVDSNAGSAQGYGDYSLVQDAIDFAVTQTPSSSSQWIVLVRPGTYTEDVTFAPWVHVLGYPGVPAEEDSFGVQVVGSHTANLASGKCIVGGLSLNTTASTTTPVLTKSGAGSLRLMDSRINSEGVSATQGPALDVTAGTVDAVGCVLTHTGGGATDRVAVVQSGTASTLEMYDCRLSGPIGLDVNPAEAANTMVTRVTRCQILANEYPVRTNGFDFEVRESVLDGNTSPLFRVHPSGGALTSNVTVGIFYTTVDSIEYEVTGVVGTTTLNMGAVEYTGLTFPGGAVSAQNATVQSTSNFYDNTLSGLTAENVQDALDELAALPTIAPLDYHINMPGVPNDTVRYRAWAPVTSRVLAVRVMMESVNTQGTYTLAITNEATGNTILSAATFDMNTLVAGTPTPVSLTGVSADLDFSALDEWTITLTSDDPLFDGDSVYISLVFNTFTGAALLAADWATTLIVGNVSGGTNPVLSANDALVLTQGSSTPPTGAAQGAIWNSDGSGSLSEDTPYYRSASNGDIVSLIGGSARAFTQAGGVASQTILRGDRFIEVTLSATADLTLDLPAASTMEGVVLALKRLDADPTSTLTLDPNGAETIDGVTSVTVEQSAATLIACTGTSWQTLEVGPPDDDQREITVLPGGTINSLWFAPYACTVTAIKVYADTSPATAGVYTLAVEDIDGSNNLISTATFDLTSLVSGTLTTLTLTGTTADLELATGTRVRFQFVSDNGDLTGDGVYTQIIYRSQ